MVCRLSPSAPKVPSTVASSVVPEPMIKLLTMERRQTSDTRSSSNQRVE